MSSIIDLRVDTDKLAAQAGNVSDAVKKLRLDFDRLWQAIDDTKAYWRGAAGDGHRKRYEKQSGAIQDILSDLEKYPDDILEMAGVYKRAENQNVGIAQSLRSDIVFSGE